MDQTIVSPLTKNSPAHHYLGIPAKDVMDIYQKQLSVDVSRFFKGYTGIAIYKCNKTGYKFYYPDSLEADGKFYEELYFSKPGNNVKPGWKNEFLVALDLLQGNETVLDIGCDDGTFLLSAKQIAKKVYGLELNAESCRRCADRGLEVFNETVEQHAKKTGIQYDMITAFQVLEHIYDVHSFLDHILGLLKPGGRMVLAVPNNEPFFLGYDVYTPLNMPPHHVGLWNKKAFQSLPDLFPVRLVSASYRNKGSVFAHSYYHAKYLAKVRSLKHEHSKKDWAKIAVAALATVPFAFFKKIFKGINGNYITVVFEKTSAAS